MSSYRRKRSAVRKSFLASAGLASALLLSAILAACKNPLAQEVIKLREVAISPKMSIAIEGGAALPNAGAYDFGEVGVTENVKEEFFVITNSGLTELSIPAATALIAGTDADLFTFGTPLPDRLLPAGTARFSIKFLPGTIGRKSAAISFVTNDTENTTFTLNIAGIGIMQVAAPVFAGGTSQSYPDGGNPLVEITCTTPNASIYYTTDGSSPIVATVNGSTTKYNGIFASPTIPDTGSLIIRAIAHVEGVNEFKDSSIVSAYLSKVAIKAPVFSVLDSTFYSADTLPSFSVSSESTNAFILYTIDNSEPVFSPLTPEGTYSGTHYLKNGANIQYLGAHPGGTLTVRAKAVITQYQMTADVSATYGFRLSAPEFSPVPQVAFFASAPSISMSVPKSLGTIKFTDTGVDPVTGSPAYSAPVAVPAGAPGSSTTQVLKAFAEDENWLPSAITSGVYYVCGPGRWSDGTNNSKWDQATWQ